MKETTKKHLKRIDILREYKEDGIKNKLCITKYELEQGETLSKSDVSIYVKLGKDDYKHLLDALRFELIHFKHAKILVTKSRTISQNYLKRTIENQWSAQVLQNKINSFKRNSFNIYSYSEELFLKNKAVKATVTNNKIIIRFNNDQELKSVLEKLDIKEE